MTVAATKLEFSAPGEASEWRVKRPPLLEAQHISKRFGSLVALDDVSFTLAPGSFHALLGENGAGKSTLVKCIMGFYRADSGKVLVGDSEVVVGSR